MSFYSSDHSGWLVKMNSFNSPPVFFYLFTFPDNLNIYLSSSKIADKGKNPIPFHSDAADLEMLILKSPFLFSPFLLNLLFFLSDFSEE
jgi:hypothetical protein